MIKPRIFNVLFKINNTPSCFGHGIIKDRMVFLLLAASNSGFKDVLCCEPVWCSERATGETLGSLAVADPPTHPFGSGAAAELCMRGSEGSQFGGDGWDGAGQQPVFQTKTQGQQFICLSTPSQAVVIKPE